MMKIQLLLYSCFVLCVACGAKSKDSSAKIDAGYYAADSADHAQVPLASFISTGDRMQSYEVKMILWQDGSSYNAFGKGGATSSYSNGPVPGSVSSKISTQNVVTYREETGFYPQDDGSVRAELTLSQLSPAWSDKKSWTLKKVAKDDFLARFRALAKSIVVNKDDLDPSRIDPAAKDFCDNNFQQTCQDLLK